MSVFALRPQGRHRIARLRLTMWQRAAAAGWIVCLTTATSVAWPVAASADAPLQTAWWNMASGSAAPPDPSTPAGGLHISALSSNVLAFGAVQYNLPSGGSGQLVLQVATGAAPPAVDPSNPSTTPTFTFEACPTIGAWRAGDDQPAASAPSYDAKHCFGGNESADAKTVSFFVDGSHQSKPGVLSLAIVPLPSNQVPTVGGDSPIDTTPPTSVDFDKPDVGSLTVTGGQSQPLPVATGTGTGAAAAPSAAGNGAKSGTATGSGSATTGASGSMPTINTGPSLTTETPGQGVSPVVAGNTAVAPNTTPTAATAPAVSHKHNWALVLLLLLGFAVLASMIQRNNATAPIGERGLGRFRQARERHARPLI